MTLRNCVKILVICSAISLPQSIYCSGGSGGSSNPSDMITVFLIESACATVKHLFHPATIASILSSGYWIFTVKDLKKENAEFHKQRLMLLNSESIETDLRTRNLLEQMGAFTEEEKQKSLEDLKKRLLASNRRQANKNQPETVQEMLKAKNPDVLPVNNNQQIQDKNVSLKEAVVQK